eukprot:1211877-Pleurochrysis_carterae.AAC.1
MAAIARWPYRRRAGQRSVRARRRSALPPPRPGAPARAAASTLSAERALGPLRLGAVVVAVHRVAKLAPQEPRLWHVRVHLDSGGDELGALMHRLPVASAAVGRRRRRRREHQLALELEHLRLFARRHERACSRSFAKELPKSE